MIELLVVMVIIAVIMGLVMPMGSKMLSSFQEYTQRVSEKHEFKSHQAYAFIEARDVNATYEGVHYKISSKGIVEHYAQSNDDR